MKNKVCVSSLKSLTLAAVNNWPNLRLLPLAFVATAFVALSFTEAMALPATDLSPKANASDQAGNTSGSPISELKRKAEQESEAVVAEVSARQTSLSPATNVGTNARNSRSNRASRVASTESVSGALSSEGSINNPLSLPRSDGALQFSDPFADPAPRSYFWVAQLSVQSYQPQGLGKLDGGIRYELSNAGRTFLPQVSFGMQSRDLSWGESNWRSQISASLGLGYVNQGMRLQLPNGSDLDARLATTRGEIELMGTLQSPEARHLGLSASALLGRQLMTQGSSNEFARWSATTNYWGYAAGVFWQQNIIRVTARAVQRQASSGETDLMSNGSGPEPQIAVGAQW